ncbi:MAG: hypothetical protein IJ899_11940 [Blautia sp.]|nr:hypothetical protein [Blautia sp.]
MKKISKQMKVRCAALFLSICFLSVFALRTSYVEAEETRKEEQTADSGDTDTQDFDLSLLGELDDEELRQFLDAIGLQDVDVERVRQLVKEEEPEELSEEGVHQVLDLSGLEDIGDEETAQRGLDLSSLLSAALEAGLGSLGSGSSSGSSSAAAGTEEGSMGLLDILNLLGITSRSLKDCEIKAIADQKYTGNEIKPTVTVTYNGTRLKKNTDFTVSYSNNISVGTARVTITGKGSYTGTRQTSFHIVRTQGSGSSTQSAASKAKKLTVKLTKTSYVYDGKAHTPAPKVTAGGKTVTKANYTVTYKDNKNVGKATVTVKGKGEYKGLTGEATFKITLKKTSIRSVGKPAPGELKPAWNKDTQAEGYQLWVCTNKSFGSGVKKITVKDANETESLVTGLTSGKKYYLKLRSYKKVGSTNWYSEWSTVKEATVS